MPMGTLVLFFIVLLSIYIFRHYFSKKPFQKLPPSPPALPFIGHLHLLKPPRALSIHSLSKSYGPVVALRLGSKNAIILSSSAAAEEALIKNDSVFSNRPLISAGKVLGYKSTSLFFAPHGSHWRNLRRLTSSQLFSTRQLNIFAGIRSKEFLSLIRRMVKDSSSGEIDLIARLFEMKYNVMAKMVVGEGNDCDSSDVDVEMAKHFKDLFDEAVYLLFCFNPGDFFPALGWLDLLGIERRLEKLRPRLDRFLEDILEDARRRRRSEAASRDQKAEKNSMEEEKSMLDVMLSMQETDPESFTDEIIKGQVLNLLLAGADTTAVMMEKTMLFVLSHPETLKKVKAEIDTNVGHDHIVDESDLPKVPYLNNILKETLRLSSIAQEFPARESSGDCTIQNYHIPKGTLLFIDVWGIQRDQELWDDAMSFNPDRYNGEKEDKVFMYMPFGAGRRKCIGEPLAVRTIMASIGALVQCFDWEPLSGEEVDLDSLLGLTVPKGKPVVAKYKVRPCMADALAKI